MCVSRQQRSAEFMFTGYAKAFTAAHAGRGGHRGIRLFALEELKLYQLLFTCRGVMLGGFILPSKDLNTRSKSKSSSSHQNAPLLVLQ